MQDHHERLRFASSGLARIGGVTLLSTLMLALYGSGCSSSDTKGGSGAGGAPSAGGSLTASAGGAFLAAGGAAPACHPVGQSCADATECCEGNICNTIGPAPEWVGCQKPCSANTECSSTCCMHFQGADHGFCTDPKWCSCGDTAARCGSNLPKCCDTHVCLGGDAQPTFYECKKKCTTGADCDTGCCVPIPNMNLSACLAASYCPK